jgi:glycerophosphoryl diester phosphodiesterase
MLPPSLSWDTRFPRPLVLGHRGARRAAPENTLRAFELARLEGAAGTELDVQTSADGKVHVVHDLDLGRVTSGRDTRKVRQLTRAELDQVELDSGESIPRLESVLAWGKAHGLLLNVELKTAQARSDRIAEATAALLTGEYAEYAKRCVAVSSFHPSLLLRFHQVAPEIRTAFLVTATHPTWCTPAWLERLGCGAVHPQVSYLLANSELASLFRNFQINTWTVNDPALASTLVQRGVFAVITDVPGQLLATGQFATTA